MVTCSGSEHFLLASAFGNYYLFFSFSFSVSSSSYSSSLSVCMHAYVWACWYGACACAVLHACAVIMSCCRLACVDMPVHAWRSKDVLAVFSITLHLVPLRQSLAEPRHSPPLPPLNWQLTSPSQRIVSFQCFWHLLNCIQMCYFPHRCTSDSTRTT